MSLSLLFSHATKPITEPSLPDPFSTSHMMSDTDFQACPVPQEVEIYNHTIDGYGALYIQHCLHVVLGPLTEVKSNASGQERGPGCLKSNSRQDVIHAICGGSDGDGYLKATVNDEKFSFMHFATQASENPGFYPSWDELSQIVRFVLLNGDLFTPIATCFVEGQDIPQRARQDHVFPLGHFTALGFVACVSAYLKSYVPPRTAPGKDQSLATPKGEASSWSTRDWHSISFDISTQLPDRAQAYPDLQGAHYTTTPVQEPE